MHAKGKCRSCYDKDLKETNPEYAQRQKENAKNWVTRNKARAAEWKRKWVAKQDPQYGRRKTLKEYGLTIDDYEAMLATQNGACAICRKPPGNDKALNVDHCHKTGRVRGLLCFRCNFGLSFFSEDEAMLKRAAEHVKEPK